VLSRYTIALSALLCWRTTEPDPQQLGSQSFLQLSIF
jgi:hypothetical protein